MDMQTKPLLAVDMRHQWEAIATYASDNLILAHVIVCVVFLSFRFLYLMIFKAFGFQAGKQVQEIAASCVACMHSTTICIFAYEELASRGWAPFSMRENFDLASANTKTGIAAMIFTNSYMLQDLVLMLRYSPEETLFIGHHIATMLYMCSCMIIGAGDLSVMLCIFLGEITNPIINGYIIVDIMASSGLPSGEAITLVLALLLFAALTLIRVLYAPWGLCWRFVSFFLMDPRAAAIPLPLRLVWIALPLIVVYGSFLFLRDLLADIRAGTTTRAAKEQRLKASKAQ